MQTRTIPGRPRGFTLIELLVVVAIIALLIAILLPSLNNARIVSRRTTGAANLSGIGKAMGVYVSEWGILPGCNHAYSPTGWAGSQTIALRTEGTWQYKGAGFAPYHLSGYLGNGVHSKLWVSPGNPEVLNPFSMPESDVEGNQNWWDMYHGTNTLQGKNIWVNMSYLFFMGDRGNTPTSVYYYTDPGFTTRYEYFNHSGGLGGRLKMEYNPGYMELMQDLARQDASGKFQSNYANGGTTIRSTYSLASSVRGTYTQGFIQSDTEQGMQGANILYADWSVVWKKTQDLTKVYINDSGTVVLYTGGPAQ